MTPLDDYPEAYLLQIQQQHAEAVERVLFEYLMWAPQLEAPKVPPQETAFVTVVVLNDKRAYYVQTAIASGETQIQRLTEKASGA